MNNILKMIYMELIGELGAIPQVSSRARLQDHEPGATGEHPAGATADTAGEGAGDEIGAAKAV